MDATELIENPMANIGGKTSFVVGLVLSWVNWIFETDINQVIVVVTSILGFIYMVLKIYKLILDIIDRNRNQNSI